MPYLGHIYRQFDEKTVLNGGLFLYKDRLSKPSSAPEKDESPEMKELQKDILRSRRVVEKLNKSYQKSVEGKNGLTGFEIHYNQDKTKIKAGKTLDELRKARKANKDLLSDQEKKMLENMELFLEDLQEKAKERSDMIQTAIKKDKEEYRKSTEGERLPQHLRESNEKVEGLTSDFLEHKKRYDELVEGNEEKDFDVIIDEDERIDVVATTTKINDILRYQSDILSKRERALLKSMQSDLMALGMAAKQNEQIKLDLKLQEEETKAREADRVYQSEETFERVTEQFEKDLEWAVALKREYDQKVEKTVIKKRRDAKEFNFVLLADGTIDVPATLKEIEKIEKKNAKILSNNEKRLLIQMKEALDMVEVVTVEKEQATSEYTWAERTRKNDEANERMKIWVGRPGYEALEEAFDAATSTPLIGTNEERFKLFWQNAGGFLSTQKARQSKELYFSIIGEQTDLFKDPKGIPLPESFGNDAEKNRDHYPYIYNQWLEHHGVDPEDLMNKEQDVKEMEDRLGGAEVAETFLAGLIDTKLSSEHPYKKELLSLNAQLEDDTINDRDYWQDKEDLAEKLLTELKVTTDSDGKILLDEATKTFLENYATYAHLQTVKFKALGSAEKAMANFTRDEMEKNPQLAVEMTMRKFQQAIKMVGNQENLHPKVYQGLVSIFYNEGVSEYRQNEDGKWEYHEDLGKDYQGIITALKTSPHFNAEAKISQFDTYHLKTMKLVKVAAEVVQAKKWDEERIDFLQQLKRAKTGKKTELSPALLKDYAGLSVTEIDQEIASIDQQDLLFDAFLKDVAIVIQDPESDQAKEVFQKVEDGAYEKGSDTGFDWKAFYNASDAPFELGVTIISAQSMKESENTLREIDINYHSFERKEHSESSSLPEGIEINLCYEIYLAKLAEDPKFHVDKWPDLFNNDFNTLVQLVDDLMVGEGINEDAKKAFMDSFRGLKGWEAGTSFENEGQAAAFGTYEELILEIRLREKLRANSDLKIDEINAKVNGMTMGDKIGEMFYGIWDDMVGPGKTGMERAAGFILGYMTIKGLLYAKNGTGGWSTALKLLIAAGAIEIATDGAISDALGLGLLSDEMQETFEGVLLDKGKEGVENDKGITSTEHAAALVELRDVPFHELVAWYESSKSSGKPRVPGSPDLFPHQIDTSVIYKDDGLKNPFGKNLDPEVQSRRIVYAAVENLFKYEAAKPKYGVTGNNAAAFGKDKLVDRWITYYDHPNAVRDKFHAEQMGFLLESYRNRRHELTWQVVMRTTIDRQDVEATKKTTLLEDAQQAAIDFVNWGEDEIRNLVGGNDEFFENLGQGGEDLKDFLADVGEAGGEKLHIAKDNITFWFEDNQYKITQWGEDKLKIVTLSGETAWNTFVALDKIGTEFTLKSLRQLRAASGSGDIELTENGAAFSVTDIVASGDPKDLNILNEEVNPRTVDFDLYQRSSYEAYKDFEAHPDQGYGFFSNDKERSFDYPDTNVGYYFTETTIEDIYVREYDDKEDVLEELKKKSWEKAKEFFVNTQEGVPKRAPSLTSSQVERYMKPIIIKGKHTHPPTVYAIWRMPLANSDELYLKETDQWLDYMDPMMHSDRLPFDQFDNTKSFTENMILALNLRTGVTGTIARSLAPATGYSLYTSLRTFEFTGNFFAGIGTTVGYSEAEVKWIEDLFGSQERTRQQIDELIGSASKAYDGSEDLRQDSAFYANKHNALVYKICHEYAARYNQRLFLGLFEGHSGYEGTDYVGKANMPEGFKYEHLLNFYVNDWLDPDNTDKNESSELFVKLMEKKLGRPLTDDDLKKKAQPKQTP